MAGLRNPFDDVNLKVLGEISTYRKKAIASNPVPVGTERIKPSEAKRRISQMTPEQRQAMTSTPGWGKQFREMLKSERGHNGG